jgi:hypothetical protein
VRLLCRQLGHRVRRKISVLQVRYQSAWCERCGAEMDYYTLRERL